MGFPSLGKIYSKGILASLILFFIFIPSKCSAEDALINLKAQSLKYEEEGRVVTAVGSVEVRLKDLYIRSDVAKVSVDSGIATAEGNVTISRKRYNALADSISYDASTEGTTLRNFSSVIEGENISGKVFIKAEYAKETENMSSGDEGGVTTCDYEETHYHLQARKFEFYPEDKIVCYSVTFYIGALPVMWMPYFIYSIKDKRSTNMPVFGRNDVEGDFVKTSWDYFFNNGSYGTVYLDLMQKKGFGHGFLEEYKLSKYHEGKFYLYHLNEQDTHLTDWVAKLDHNIKFDQYSNLLLSYNYSNIYLVPAGRMDQNQTRVDYNYSKERKLNVSFSELDDSFNHFRNYNFALNHSFNNFDTSYLFSQSHTTADPGWTREQQRFTYKQPFIFDDSTFGTTLNFYKNTTGDAYSPDERLEPEMVFNKKGDFYNLRVSENWYLDLDNKNYLGDVNDEYIEKQPEIECAFRPIRTYGFSISNNIAWARFHEAKYVGTLGRIRDFTSNRSKFGTDVSRSDSLPLNTTLMLFGGVDQFLYGPGDSRYVLREGVGVRTELGGFFRNYIDYKRGFSEGSSPFFFDSIGNNYDNIKNTLSMYHTDKVIWVVDGGYNFSAHKYFDLLTNLTIAPERRFRLYLSGGYDIENQRYRDFVTGMHVVPFPGTYADINSVHDLNSGALRSADSLFDIEMGDDWTNKWHIRAGNVYDFFTKRFLLRDLMIVKDLHCWEAKFMYSDYNKEYTFSFTLKAFPSQPFGWSTGGGLFFQGFDQEFTGESPRRY
ncbi:MAG: DUF3769 domain-containing protein [Candidatus Saganbacteria bacterium]|nr:DUF3769 domain-containing protein [Candidatus Saganbacteria bacterium]